MPEFVVRPAGPDDADGWERLRHFLWPAEPGEHRSEIADYFEGAWSRPSEILLAFDDSGRAVGLAELSLRSCAEGCTSSPVAYLEGWFVLPELRRNGVGAALVEAAQDWARARGCTEFASDVELSNSVSECAHRALGFEEVVRTICYRKSL